MRTFVSPDSSYSELERFIESAETSIYVNTYTLTSTDVARLLEDAKARGKDVILMLDNSPVGGIPKAEGIIADRLLEAGARVCFYSFNGTRFNHAKYIVVDNRSALIATENLGVDGYPKENSYGERGWGVVIQNIGLSKSLAEIFFSDLANCKWKQVLSKDKPEGIIEGGPYEPKYQAEEFAGLYNVEVFTAPEEGVEHILRLLKSANDSILIEQAYIYKSWGRKRDSGDSPNLFLEEAIDAARRGVKVRILMDSYWYNVLEDDPKSNPKTLEYVNRVAKVEGLDLEARLIDLNALGVLRLHTKGVIVDGSAVLVSSINWNQHSPTKNREIGIIIYGEPAGYFAKVFECDWEPSSCNGEGVPGWVPALGVLSFSAAYLVRKRRFRAS